MLAQGAIDCGLELWSGKIGICCISAKNTDLRSKIKDWFTQKQDVFVNRDMFYFWLTLWNLQVFLTGWIFKYFSINLPDHDRHSDKYWVNLTCTIKDHGIIETFIFFSYLFFPHIVNVHPFKKELYLQPRFHML
jgi:hypothetical protein